MTIIGDLNLPNINWLFLVGSTNVSNIFYDFVFECDLSQLVTVPTHCIGTCLDLVLTNSPHAINNVQVGSSSVMKSDHLLVSFSLTTQFRPSFNVHETQYVINFSKLNYLELAEYILDFDFLLCLNCNDVEIVWSQIRTIIHNAIFLFAPKVKLRSREKLSEMV